MVVWHDANYSLCSSCCCNCLQDFLLSCGIVFPMYLFLCKRGGGEVGDRIVLGQARIVGGPATKYSTDNTVNHLQMVSAVLLWLFKLHYLKMMDINNKDATAENKVQNCTVYCMTPINAEHTF